MLDGAGRKETKRNLRAIACWKNMCAESNDAAVGWLQ